MPPGVCPAICRGRGESQGPSATPAGPVPLGGARGPAAGIHQAPTSGAGEAEDIGRAASPATAAATTASST